LDDVSEDEYRSEPSSEDESECCEGGFADAIGVSADGSLKMEYNDIELRQLKVVHVEGPLVPNFMDISTVDEAICDIGLTLLADDIPDNEEVEIKKGMVFDMLEHLKYFLMDYAVRFHRPYYVTHSDKNKRYTVLCKNGCQWGLWAQRLRNEKWKIRNMR
jgi:rhodanese-related sulfurtransferase